MKIVESLSKYVENLLANFRMLADPSLVLQVHRWAYKKGKLYAPPNQCCDFWMRRDKRFHNRRELLD